MLARPLAARRPARRGATLVESAFVISILLMLLLGTILGAAAVFNYQQVGYLAREGSRWASVHGAEYAREQRVAAPTAADVYEQGVKPHLGGMRPERVSYTVTWDKDNSQTHTAVRNDQVVAVRNTVTVTVSYQWDPIFLFGPFTLRSTSVSDMHY